MNIIGLKKINNAVFKYLIWLFMFDAITIYVISFYIKSFAYIPYYRLAVLVFTFTYFIKSFFLKKIKINVGNLKNEDYIVILWCFFSIIEMLYGFLNKNPLLYVFADFIYILFGSYIYFSLSSNALINNQKISNLINYNKWLLLIFTSLYFTGCFISENFYFVLLSLTYVFAIQKKYLIALMTIIPFFLQVQNSNRALLICFITVLLLYFSYKISLLLKKNDRIIVLSFIMFIPIFFYEEILTLLLGVFHENTDLYYRLKQLLDIIKNGVDFSNPKHTSISQRLIEAKVVINLWVTDIKSFIFGCGLGGVIDGKYFIDASVTKTALLGTKSIHNIHLLPFALIHKYGLLGVIMFSILVLDLINSFNIIIKKNTNVIFIFWNVIFILIFVYSLPAASFLWASPLFWISLSMKRSILYERKNNKYD